MRTPARRLPAMCLRRETRQEIYGAYLEAGGTCMRGSKYVIFVDPRPQSEYSSHTWIPREGFFYVL